ncbi:alkane 1-monooxygenase [Aquimarina addita]|uniref:Alkane 1-monooxygenase n=1 Tax=Aquimarina addita TaxID=870485 RepID=A0ABP7XAK7_9FLAO
MKDLKYIAAYSIPIIASISIFLRGYYSFLTPVYVFGIIPFIEFFTPASTENLDDTTRLSKSKRKVFNWLLYINLPIIYSILFFALFTITTTTLHLYEIIGIIISTGIVLGANGINVAHELGHRFTKERFIAKVLLLPSLYMHFYVEHNFGHHQKAATKDDPATAAFNQPLYFFWFTSVIGQYYSAWKIQKSILTQHKLSFLSIKNDMLWYQIITIFYLAIIFLCFNVTGLVFAVLCGIVGFLLLETINYIEHYGLVRKKTTSGRYERVREIHSWNSNHLLGRILLFELTRHSDHHYRASKKYQILDHHDLSPQLPYGYPTSMVLSFFPPIWFKLMNKHIPDQMKT